MTLRRTLATLAICCLAIAGATSTKAALLSDVIGLGQTIQVGDLLFSNFTYSQTGDMPAPTGINVLPYTSASGDNGLTFQAAFVDLPGGNGSDGVIGYTVTELTPGAQINGSTLSGAPTVIAGNGVVSVTESFLPTDPSDLFSIYSIQPGAIQQSTGSLFFATPAASFTVQESILAASMGGVPSISFFHATFSTAGGQIPEPSSILLMGLGLTGLAWRRWRRK